MRFPVFGHRSNPSVDPPICRKKTAYVQSLISERLADWIDPENQALGVLLRGRFLPERDHEQVIAGSGFDSAWSIKQSGYAGPNVWQLKSDKCSIAG
jgi:hypothetical protein